MIFVVMYLAMCFAGKYATLKIHRKLQFLSLISKDINDIIPHFFTVICANSQSTHDKLKENCTDALRYEFYFFV